MRIRVLASVLAAAVALAGCGSAHRPGQRIRGSTLSVYFSGPLHGASSTGARAALNGARLALADVGGRVGRYRVTLKVLDDSTTASDGWDPNQASLNARQAAQDPTTVGYLGDFNSGASAISIPVLNRAGIPQISPGSTAVGLTSTGPGRAPGEPTKYYPTGTRTFARAVPTDATQARALVASERMNGCRSTFVLQDGEVDGEDMALTFLLTAQSAGLQVVGNDSFQRQALTYSSLVSHVASTGADCVLISAIDERSSALLVKQLARALPAGTIFVSNGLANSAFINASPRSLDSRLIVLSATLPAGQYPPAVRAFLARYVHRYGPAEPPAIFGCVAMQLMLDVIDDGTDGGHKQADRAKVVGALFDGDQRSTILGMLRVDRAGDVTINRFGIDAVVRGRLSFLQPAG